MSGEVLALVNGRAGGIVADAARGDVTRLIQDALPDAVVVFTEESTDVAGAARAGVDGGVRMIVAGGGDGTINAVASALAGTDTVLGLLPCGTLNHFAKDLGVPTDLAAAARVLAEGRVAHVDVGEVNGSVFVNNSGLGLHPTIVALRDGRRAGGMGRWPAFVWATAKALSRYRLLRIHIAAGGQALVRTTPIIFVGNNRYEMEGLHIGTRDRLDGGELCLYIPHHEGPARLLWFTLLALLGRRSSRDDFDYLYAPALTIASPNSRLQVSLDGEVTVMTPPLTYRIRPGALRVMVPAAAPD